MMAQLHNRTHSFRQNLDHLSAQGQHDAFVNEAMETFGRFDAPNGECSHLWEIQLHDITANGASAEEAMANWKRLADQHIAPNSFSHTGPSIRATDGRLDDPYNGQRPI